MVLAVLHLITNENNTGYSNAVQFVVNLGGAMGDSSWIAAGDAPMIGIHCVDDPFAPFMVLGVYVPTTTTSCC